MNFQYTALSPTSQKLTGTIEAVSETEAREKLNKLSLSIIDLKMLAAEAPLAKPSSGIRFLFEATDRNGKHVVGTVDAKDESEAFAKLIADYQLNVTALFSEGVSEDEKKKALASLALMKEEFAKKQAKTEESAKLLAKEKEQEKKELLSKVEITIQTIQAFLNEYGESMKPEERERIRAYLNQLFRIKDSTNLAHIQKTCETMLAYLRDREIFLKEALKIREQATVKVESKHLLEELKHTGFGREIDAEMILRFFRKIPGLQGFIEIMMQRFAFDDPQAMGLRKKIKDLSSRLWEFRKIHFKSKDPSYKAEIAQSIEALKQEKKRYTFELRGIVTQRQEALAAQKQKTGFAEFGNIDLLIGWLLAFYLIFYFITFPFNFKNLGFASVVPETFHFYNVSFLKILLPLLFLLHIARTIKEELFSTKILPSFLIYTFFGVAYLFYVSNFA